MCPILSADLYDAKASSGSGRGRCPCFEPSVVAHQPFCKSRCNFDPPFRGNTSATERWSLVARENYIYFVNVEYGHTLSDSCARALTSAFCCWDRNARRKRTHPTRSMQYVSSRTASARCLTCCRQKPATMAWPMRLERLPRKLRRYVTICEQATQATCPDRRRVFGGAAH